MLQTITIDRLGEALAAHSERMVSLVGGGGKTTALFALGRQLTGTVVLSTTTKMGSDRTGGHRPTLDPSEAELASVLASDRVALVWKGIEDHRAIGFSPEECAGFAALADHVVLEADGSRRKPFKAPAVHEPVVPSSTTLLVACVGAGAFDAPIDAVCHRPELVASIARCAPIDPLDPVRLAAVLASGHGSRKDCPDGARFVVLLNQVTVRHADFVDRLDRALGGAVAIVAVEPFAPGDSPED